MTNFNIDTTLELVTDNEREEFIPVIPEDDIENNDETYPDELPILPIRNAVLFPGVIMPITVGRQRSIRLIKQAHQDNKIIGVITQKNIHSDEPEPDELYQVGVVAKILKLLTLPDGNTTIIIQGRQKFELVDIFDHDPYYKAQVNYLTDKVPPQDSRESTALMESLKEAAQKILQLNPEIPQEAEVALENIDSLNFLIHFLCSNIQADITEKQILLEYTNAKIRANKLLEHMLQEIQLLELKQEINSKAHSDIDRQQRDFFLRQQMKVLQDELGDGSLEKDLEEIRKKGAKKKWSEEVAQHFDKELSKIARLNPMSPDYGTALGYIEFLTDLPWNEYTKDNYDLTRALSILDKAHYGLQKPKERILEYLAVLQLKNDMKAPILCFYGPPGVGKTSLGKSIAKSLKRKYVRMSLGGLHDEAEIRGHRKTYIGAMAGRIMQNIKKAGSSNPVFILDEIDKVGSDFRGDPASALLEVLDPEQNKDFDDNYLEVSYDLSKVLFVATANTLDTIHPALRDRMEMIDINGYTLEEKIEIAKKHLIPKLRKEHGLTARQVAFNPTAISYLIDNYTRESGVRNLNQKLAKVIRNVAKSVVIGESYNKRLKVSDIERILGIPTFDKEIYEDNEEDAGVVTGLAWTQTGGEILFIEANLSRGKGNLILSGQLGDVMKESATAALSYLKSQSDNLGIDYRIFSNYDLHIHVPAGAVPKDGPSAGITMFTALASIYTQRKVKTKLAMTGEITLRGRVLPVGGIKEKILAARRAGITELILSERNRKDILEIENQYIDGLIFHYVKRASEVLDIALLPETVAHPIHFNIKA